MLRAGSVIVKIIAFFRCEAVYSAINSVSASTRNIPEIRKFPKQAFARAPQVRASVRRGAGVKNVNYWRFAAARISYNCQARAE